MKHLTWMCLESQPPVFSHKWTGEFVWSFQPGHSYLSVPDLAMDLLTEVFFLISYVTSGGTHTREIREHLPSHPGQLNQPWLSAG